MSWGLSIIIQTPSWLILPLIYFQDRAAICTDIVELFTKSNIALEKVNEAAWRKFFQNHLKGGGSIPLADTLRREYLPKVSTISSLSLLFRYNK